MKQAYSFTPLLRADFLQSALRKHIKTALVGLTLATLSALPAHALNTAYYVDSAAGDDDNPGTSQTAPWQTLTKVNGIVFEPGDSILFKRGCSWTGTLYPKVGSNGTATARITWGAYGPETDPDPKINAGSEKYAIQLWGRAYTTIQDFEVTNDGDGVTEGTRIGIYVGIGAQGTASGIKILNNNIHHVRGFSSNEWKTHTAGIYIEYLLNDVGTRYKFDDLLIEGNYVHDMTAGGLYMKSPTWMSQGDKTWWSTNVVIKNNVFDKLGVDGVVLNGCDAPRVENNVCLDAGYNGAENVWIAGLWTCFHTRNTLFQNNEVARTRNQFTNGANGDSQAFDVDYGTEGTHTFQYNYTHDNEGGILIVMPKETKPNAVDYVKTTIYRYNLSVNDGRSTNSSSQFPVWPVKDVSDVQIYNNVFYSTRPEGFRTSSNSATYYKNNIFYAPLGIYGSKSWYSNNCFYNHTAIVGDPFKIEADPMFAGPLSGAGDDGYLPANYDRFKLLAGSPCIDRGIAVANNGGRDFWGSFPSNPGNTDIGMDELANGSSPAAVATVIDDAASAVTYSSSVWTHASNEPDFHANTKSGTDQLHQWCQVAFTGTNVSLYGRKFNNAAKLTVYIDGSSTPAAVVDCYSPTDMWRTELCRITGLSNAAHTAKFVITAHNPVSAGNWVSLDYVQVAAVTPPALPVVTDIDDTAATYAGTWTAVATDAVQYGKTRHTSSTTGSSATFSFTGTGVRLLATRAGDCGKVNISIDNGTPEQIDLFMPISYSSTLDFRSVVFEKNGLSNTTHTIKVTVDASANPKATGHRVEIDQIQALVGGAVVLPQVVVDNPIGSGSANGFSYSVAYGGGTWGQNTGNSNCYLGTSSSSITLGAYATFTFTGTGFSIHGNKSPSSGKMNVSIDGGAPVLVDAYTPVLAYQSQLFTTSGLAPGSHTVTATVAYKNSASGGNWITLDYFKYQP